MLLLGLVLIGLVATGSTGFVGLDIQRRDALTAVQYDRRQLGRRHVSQTLDNLQNLYFANITLGTPPQRLRMHIDTGSSDLWCNAPQSNLCSTSLHRCAISGTYDSTASSTYKFVNNDFNISYVDGTGALGDYVTDTISIGGQTITDFQFGVGTRSSSPEGVLGIGYAINEAQARRGRGRPYDNLPQRMLDNGLIKSNAYSLWLNDLEANTGQILFGGVNTEKYHGSLQTIPILKVAGQYSDFLLALGGITINGVSMSSPNLPAAVLLDSGTTLMYLPNDITKTIYNQVGAAIDTSSGTITAYVPCDLAHEDKTIDFTLSGVTISVPFNEIVLPSHSADGSSLQFEDGTAACVFGISPAAGGVSVLGDTFLRSAYVVYDLANHQISLAQTNFNSTTDNIKEIEVGVGGVPDAAMVSAPIINAKNIGAGAARLAAVATPTGSVVAGASTRSTMPAAVCWIFAALVGMGLSA